MNDAKVMIEAAAKAIYGLPELDFNGPWSDAHKTTRQHCEKIATAALTAAGFIPAAGKGLALRFAEAWYEHPSDETPALLAKFVTRYFEAVVEAAAKVAQDEAGPKVAAGIRAIDLDAVEVEP